MVYLLNRPNSGLVRWMGSSLNADMLFLTQLRGPLRKGLTETGVHAIDLILVDSLLGREANTRTAN